LYFRFTRKTEGAYMRTETPQEIRAYGDAMAGILPGDSELSKFYAHKALLQMRHDEYLTLERRTNDLCDRRQ